MDADEFAHIVERQPLGQHKLHLEPATDRLTGHHLVGNSAAHTNAPGIDCLLHKTGFFERDHHARIELFPHAGYGRKHRGRNFAYVLRDSLWVFHEIEFRAGIQREILATHTLGDMAQGQKTHPLVVHRLRDQRVVTVHGKDQTLVQMHSPLGLACGARGIDQDGQVLGLALGSTLAHGLGMGGQMLAAERTQRIQTDDAGVFQGT